jgi:hypothetical protein
MPRLLMDEKISTNVRAKENIPNTLAPRYLAADIIKMSMRPLLTMSALSIKAVFAPKLLQAVIDPPCSYRLNALEPSLQLRWRAEAIAIRSQKRVKGEFQIKHQSTMLWRRRTENAPIIPIDTAFENSSPLRIV